MTDNLPCAFLASESTLDRFLSDFFEHSLPKAEWNHAAHVALGAALLFHSNVTAALPKVREGLWTYIEATGGKNADDCGYHETLTVFWLKVIFARLQKLRSMSRLDAVREVVAEYGEQRKLHTEYYSGDLNCNVAARRNWVIPDLRRI